jgi:hypothetical protein
MGGGGRRFGRWRRRGRWRKTTMVVAGERKKVDGR